MGSEIEGGREGGREGEGEGEGERKRERERGGVSRIITLKTESCKRARKE